MTLAAADPGCIDRAARIMIYEDDTGYAGALALTLRDAGYDTSMASHFEAALAALEGEPPVDILLSDIVIPRGVNGLALARMARMRNRKVKVIYMTSYDLASLEHEALGPVLRKPLNAATLLTTIETVLARPAD